MKSVKEYRDQGAVGAILDEYEKAIHELKILIERISYKQLTTIVDTTTKDPDCRSIQTILSHTVGAGYTYVITIRRHKGEELDYRDIPLLDSPLEYVKALDEMFIYNVALFEDYPALKMEEFQEAKKMHTRWGQKYDVEQIMEHAIVHILRHRRQIERFLLRLV